MSKINLAKITANPDVRLTKRFYLKDGEVCKDSSSLLTQGTVENMEIEFQDLLKFFDNLKPNEACTLGVHTSNSNPTKIVCKALSYLFPDAINRTKEFFLWPSKGIFLFDFDNTDLMPQDATNILQEILGQKVAMLVRPSSSTGVIPNVNSFHIFVPYQGEAEPFRDYFKAKAINRGFLKLDITKVGSILVRTLVDTSVLSPSRLFYAAPPVLEDGVSRYAFKPFYIEGSVYKPDYDDKIFLEAEANKLIEKEKNRIYPKVKEVRDQYIEQNSEAFSKSSKLSKFDVKRYLRLHLRNYVSEFDSFYDENDQIISASSVLDGSYIGATIKDPIEPDYDGGRIVAIILDRFTIHSFAHGSRLIKITVGPKKFEAMLDEYVQGDEDRLYQLISHARVLSGLDLNKFVKIVKSALNVTKAEALEYFKLYNPFYQSNYDITEEKEFKFQATVSLPKDATHAQIARAFYEFVLPKYSVFSGGLFYYYDDTEGIYVGHDPKKELFDKLTETFDGLNNLRRMQDYNAIISNVAELKSDPDFFTEQTGIMTQDHYLTVTDEGDIVLHEPSPKFRCRYKFPVEYTEEDPKMWLEFLHNQIGEKQTKTLQYCFGAIFFQKMYLFQQALFLYGRGATGKSTVINVLAGLIPKELQTTVSPFNFGKETNRHLLAQAMVNIAAELPKLQPIPAEQFKSIIAGEPVQARLLYRNPVVIRPLASHVFAGNFLPVSEDYSDAFRRRWVIIKMDKPIPIENRITDFSNLLLEKERNEIFSWGIRGWQEVIKNNVVDLRLHKDHHEIIEDWDKRDNSVIAFLDDEDYVVRKEGYKTARKSLYTAYIEYCKVFRHRVMDKKEFTETLKKAGFEFETDENDIIFVKNLKMVVV